MLIAQQRLGADGQWDDVIRPDRWAPAQLVLVFGAPRVFRDCAIMATLRGAHPDAYIVGCTTAGEICGTDVHDDSAVATAIRFERSTVRAAARSIAAPTESRAIGAQLASDLPSDGLVHVLVFAEGLLINGSELAEGLRSSLPAHVAVTGGLAADGDRFGQTLVCAGGESEPQKVAVVGLYGQQLQVGYGSLGGWDRFGPERLVTRAEGNVVYEIDGGSALALYKRYLGAHADGLPASGLHFPLSLRASDGGPRLVRTILGIDEAAGSLRFAGDIPVGTYVQLMKANTDRLIEGASGAATAANHAPIAKGSAQLALLISCVGRRLVLGQRVEEEVEAVSDALGGLTPLCGFYSYGEIAPFASSVKCELHNQTMTITTLSER